MLEGADMESDRRKVLIVDDDPHHLEIYSLLVEQAGFKAVPTIVKFAGPEFPPETEIGLILLDYRLNSVKTAPEVAQEAQTLFPGAPILVLSDLWHMPEDVAPYAAGFVRKGEPQELISRMRGLISGSGKTQS
jgi:DNA-binding response OmpR family regulator